MNPANVLCQLAAAHAAQHPTDKSSRRQQILLSSLHSWQQLRPYRNLITRHAGLQVTYYVNSGSECNDLALRIARAVRPEATHVAVMDGAYHGHVSSVIDLSPYKFLGPGGAGRPPYVHVLPCPDTYRYGASAVLLTCWLAMPLGLEVVFHGKALCSCRWSVRCCAFIEPNQVPCIAPSEGRHDRG